MAPVRGEADGTLRAMLCIERWTRVLPLLSNVTAAEAASSTPRRRSYSSTRAAHDGRDAQRAPTATSSSASPSSSTS